MFPGGSFCWGGFFQTLYVWNVNFPFSYLMDRADRLEIIFSQIFNSLLFVTCCATPTATSFCPWYLKFQVCDLVWVLVSSLFWTLSLFFQSRKQVLQFWEKSLYYSFFLYFLFLESLCIRCWASWINSITFLYFFFFYYCCLFVVFSGTSPQAYLLILFLKFYFCYHILNFKVFPFVPNVPFLKKLHFVLAL